MRKLYSLAIAVIFLFYACTKIETTTIGYGLIPPIDGVTTLDTTLDVYKGMDECDKDDFILFADNGTGTIDENANKCSDDQQVGSFKWALLANDTRLALVDSNPDTFDVVTMTGTEMKLKIVKPNSSGQPVTTINTYKNIK